MMIPPRGPLADDDARGLSVRDRAGALTAGVLLAVAAGAWVVVVSSSMGGDDMAGMPMDAPPRGWVDGVAFVGAWAVMMTAMMLPSALPMIALYGAIQRKAAGAEKNLPVALFTLVYLGLWGLTGVPAYAGSVALSDLAGRPLAYGVAVVLIGAGVYQLSPLKQVCLRACRSPIGFLLGHWRPGRAGGVALGWRHAAYCLGCCWALMVVLVAAGAMGLPWVLLVAAVVTAEKLLPGGEWIARAAGGALLLLGGAVAARPDLIAVLRPGPMM